MPGQRNSASDECLSEDVQQNTEILFSLPKCADWLTAGVTRNTAHPFCPIPEKHWNSPETRSLLWSHVWWEIRNKHQIIFKKKKKMTQELMKAYRQTASVAHLQTEQNVPDCQTPFDRWISSCNTLQTAVGRLHFRSSTSHVNSRQGALDAFF